jgi:hypothetical protein
MTQTSTLDRLDADRVARPEPLVHALRRRVAGRYPVDPFGLDPQIADAVFPLFNLAVRVTVSGGEHVPSVGPAVIVSNRGFGIAEPAAVGLAVKRVTGRRLRVVGAPPTPILGSMTRRLGAIASSDHDVASALRAGHLVGVPLAPTWLRTGAGSAPLRVAPAMTHAPIIPAAVVPVGRFGSMIGSWQVRFGSYVRLREEYDPDDPLAVARFADAMRAAVRALLVSS